MKITNIASSTLPKLSVTIKECVNLGECLLYSQEEELAEESALYLKIRSTTYLISKDGHMLSEVFTTLPTIANLIYFSDIDKPASLSKLTLP